MIGVDDIEKNHAVINKIIFEDIRNYRNKGKEFVTQG
jgi:hypothetical protein